MLNLLHEPTASTKPSNQPITMKTIQILTAGTLLSFLAAFAPGASAQTAAPAATPPHAPATTTTSNPAPAGQPGMAGYDKVIYVQRLPSIEELATATPAGAVMERVEVLNGQVAVFYRYANGALSSVAYAQLAPTGVASTTPVPAAPAPAAVPGTDNNSAAAPQGVPVPTAPAPPGYYYYPTYSYPVEPYYYYGSPYPYAYPYPYLYPFGGIRLGIGIGIGGRGRR
jgi:hypothetical protein